MDRSRTVQAQAVPSAPGIPPTATVLGVPLALIDYERTLDWIDAAVAAGRRGYLCVAAVHTVMACAGGPGAARGRPGRRLHRPRRPAARVGAERCSATTSPTRVYGPDLMDRACERAAAHRASASTSTAAATRARSSQLAAHPARCAIPGLQIVGGHAPPFRDAHRRRGGRGRRRHQALRAPTSCGSGSASPSRRSGWRAMRDRLDAPVLIGVGAAFDFHAGLVPQAPGWMQRAGSSGCSASSRSRAACGGATCATTRASSWASRASTRAPAPAPRGTR